MKRSNRWKLRLPITKTDHKMGLNSFSMRLALRFPQFDVPLNVSLAIILLKPAFGLFHIRQLFLLVGTVFFLLAGRPKLLELAVEIVPLGLMGG
jgi:hypothetical protein